MRLRAAFAAGGIVGLLALAATLGMDQRASKAAQRFDTALHGSGPDYDAVLAGLDGPDASGLRRSLAAKAFRHVSAYDAAVAEYLGSKASTWEVFPDRLVVSLQRTQALRYGENPDQQAA